MRLFDIQHTLHKQYLAYFHSNYQPLGVISFDYGACYNSAGYGFILVLDNLEYRKYALYKGSQPITEKNDNYLYLWLLTGKVPRN